MRTSYPGARKSLGAGLASIGTVLLMIAALLVAFEAPLASAAPVGPPDEGCVRVEGGDLGVDHTVMPGGIAVSLHTWVPKPGDEDEYIGFSWTVVDGEGLGIVKGGSSNSPNGYEETWGPAVSGSWTAPEGGAAISHVDVCAIPIEIGTITIAKSTTAHPLDDTSFAFSATGVEPTSFELADGEHITFTVPNGTYTFSETLPEGWLLPSISCSGLFNSTAFATSPTDMRIELGGGDDVTCTWNNVQGGYLRIIKDADPADDTPFEFEVDDGPTYVAPFELSDPGDPSVTIGPLRAGGYHVWENLPDGWAFDHTMCTLDAYTPGTTESDGDSGMWIPVAPGAVSECVFYNEALEDPTLRLVKEWIGDPVSGDFFLYIDGQPYAPDVAWMYVDPGTHTIGETDVSATHEPGEWSCVDEAGAPFPLVGSEVTLDWEDDVTCTIVNTEYPDPILTLVKIWAGDGEPWPGFGLQVAPFGGGEAIAMTSAVPMELDPGTWVASELGEGGPGYVAGEWGGDCAADGTVVLAYGDEKICTIVNTDLPDPTLTVIKTWVDDVEPYDGFALYATPGWPAPDVPLASGMMQVMEAGTYTVWETDPPSDAWVASEWGGDCAADGTVTLAYEEHKVCTISNELLPPPELTLVKTWEGEPWDGFGLQVFAPPEFVEPMVSGVAEVFEPGDYTAMEMGMPAEGYEASEWGGDCAADGSVTLEWGDSKTCTITNYEIPTIVLIKTVIGGDAEPDDFELRIVPRDGDPIPMLSGVEIEIEPGGYQALETELEKYIADPWGGDCDDDGSFEIGWGDHYECTITNVDPLPKLTVTKIVIGGDAEPDDFELTVTPVGGAAIPVLSGEKNDFEPGDYVAGETNLVGYAAGEWGGDCAADGAVTLRPVTAEVQDDLECTITNVATTTTTTILNTTVTRGTTPTTEGGTTTTATTIPDLPRTGGGGIGGVGYLPMLLGGLGLALLGAGLVLLAPRRQRLQVV